MEALAHLRLNSPDSVENAQNSIASAWSYQTETGNQIPQLLSLAHMIDISCSIRQGNPAVMLTKVNAVQKMMDAVRTDDDTWGVMIESVAIPINRTATSSHIVSPDTRDVLGIGRDGSDVLMLSFIGKKDAFSLV